MGRTSSSSLCKTNLDKLNRFINKLNKNQKLTDDDRKQISVNITDIINKDVKSLKDCSEKNVTEYYIISLTNKLDVIEDINDIYTNQFWNELKKSVRYSLSCKYTSNKTFDNNIDRYFNDVKKEYIRHPFNESQDLEFKEENFDIFIKNNLKLVIECAKRYQNLGLSFDDLIQAGNEGLLKALIRYKADKANLRVSLLNILNESTLRSFGYDDAVKIIKKGFIYPKNLEATLEKLPEEGFETKIEFENWIKSNIKPASFASVAFMWIRAQIIIELNRVGCIINIPKSAQNKGMSMPNIIRLDSINPHTDDCYHDNQTAEISNNEFAIEDENIELNERVAMFKEIIEKSLNVLGNTERRIVKKRFGINYPYEMSISDIAENENLSTNNVKYMLNLSFKKIEASIPKHDKELIRSLLRE